MLIASLIRAAVLFVVPAIVFSARPAMAQSVAQPNVVIIFADDLGYGDLSSYGHPTISTPNLDLMASEGMKFTQFYVGAPTCTPSRAALLTGRLPVRSGMVDEDLPVLFPFSRGGLPADEITLAELLRDAGYATAAVGKWHLGHQREHMPLRHGFQYFFGVPYSNDMEVERRGDPPLPLYRNDSVIEQPADQSSLTHRYTEEAIRFIREHRGEPFFLYLAHTFPHVPLHASEPFTGSSRRGLYGDVVEELDFSTGQILSEIKRLGLDENTLVVFTSDNGPATHKGLDGGSAGPLRGRKGTTWEGGFRVPAIFWWPGTVEEGTVTAELAATMDLLPTAASLAGAPLPSNRKLDGVDLSALLKGSQPNSPRESVFYYSGPTLYAVRHGPWKAHSVTRDRRWRDEGQEHDPPLLYHLGRDVAERFDVASEHPDVVGDIRRIREEHLAGVTPATSQLANTK